MNQKQPGGLLGRLAVQLKVVTPEQLADATQDLGGGGEADLGEVLLARSLVTPVQLRKLMQLRQQLIAKHRAKQGPGGPVPPPNRPRPRAPRPAATTPEPAVQTPEPAVQTPEAAVQTPEAAVQTPEAAVGTPATAVRTPKPPVQAPGSADEKRERPARAAGVAQPSADAPSLGLTLASVDSNDRERLDALLRDAVARGASDIHLHVATPVRIRVAGRLENVGETPLTVEEAERLGLAALDDTERAGLARCGEVDFCYALDGVGRFRSNVYRQQRGLDAVFRSIPAEPPTLQALGLPESLAKLTEYHQGMVLVTGPAGCGKSSTMAALVDLVNETRDEHILCVEDPIEYVHRSKRCLVNQRHAGRHTDSFARALRGALREDPDIIVIGELRDLETISLAMTAAETGHFVLATLHTNNAIRTINRVVGSFPPNEQDQVRSMLSASLRAVVSQRLVPRKDGQGRVPAVELLKITRAVSNLIRKNETVQIRSVLQTGATQGMCLLDNSLAELVRTGVVEEAEALRHAEDPKLISQS